MENEGTTRLDELGIVAEALEVCLLGTIDIEMVRVGGCDDGHPRTEPVEGAVELVGLNDDIVTLGGQDIVGSVVL